jgi:hypothetical protein
MALHGGKIERKRGQDVTTGPSMAPEPDVPRNPADTLRTAALPTRPAQQVTLSRPMERPVRLYRREDPSASPEMYCEPLPEAVDPSEGKFGQDPNKYSKAPKESEYTENGGLIYGT